MVERTKDIPNVIKEAITDLESFGAIKQIKEIKINDTHVIVKVAWEVTLPNKFLNKGISDTGVRDEEEVSWLFPMSYPTHPPIPYLREDFSKNNPHINPYVSGEMTNPCISELSLSDLLHSKGFISLLRAMNDWLFNAAANNLHSPIQGWEPIVREEKGILFCEVDQIKNDLETKYRYARYYEYEYNKHSDDSGEFLFGKLQSNSIGHANSVLKDSHFGVFKYTQKNISIALLIQSEKVIDYYNVEKISNFAGLLNLVDSLGLSSGFKQRINFVSQKLWNKNKKLMPSDEVLVVLALKRPFHLIGAKSCFELLTYSIKVEKNNNGEINDSSRIIPVQLMQKCNSGMLRKVSGIDSNKVTKITMLGCGSLGSKITLHLAKSGQYQFQLVDKSLMSAHNNARHGLILGSTDSIESLLHNKAALLKSEIEKLGCNAVSDNKNILSIGEKKGLKINKFSDFIIDSTASLSVRYFLTHNCTFSSRLIHSVLYGKAKMGVISIEGKNREVRTDDVIAFMEMLSIESDQIRSILFNTNDTDRYEFAAGCSSYTTVMKDTDISFMASGLSTHIDNYINDVPKDEGKLIIGLIDENYSLNWKSHDLKATKIIDRSKNNGWEVRIIGDVFEQIKSQSKLFPGKENGGILVGQTCVLSKIIYVTALIDAPKNSVRTKDRFYLPVKEIIPTIKSISEKTNNEIGFLGTWHSHTASEPPSELDKDTLEKLVSVSSEPVVMLVYIDDELVPVPYKNQSVLEGEIHA